MQMKEKGGFLYTVYHIQKRIFNMNYFFRMQVKNYIFFLFQIPESLDNFTQRTQRAQGRKLIQSVKWLSNYI
jgi:hypothetical protein